MALLEQELQKKIDELRFSANSFYKTDKTKYFQLKNEAWNLYPVPKNQWGEAYSLAKDFFRVYIREMELEEARNWLEKMIECNNHLHLFDYDVDFNEGKYFFEIGKYEDALAKWKYVVDEAGLRYFEREKPEYLDFYKNPKKFI
ncbi:hypothetical protein [Zobellia laminariae]|uniref:hypothetical protein n=1 Tax=Zobellia laminariae TaxID=248906 RepID=UPI0026F42EC8|nr:hypothetical protein [Zobellia laminariae]WKX76183.1 hypothetical protein Q5W13_21870 [Zobellia laminariae]